MKTCKSCNLEKSAEQFDWKLKRENKRASVCKICSSIKRRSLEYRRKQKIRNEKYYAANKETHKELARQRHARTKHTGRHRVNSLKRNFGMSLQDYNKKLEEQKGVCAICFKNETAIHNITRQIKNLAVDHCHNTNKVRGLLCQRCNNAIGFLNDNEEIARNAINYLIKWKE